MRIVQERQSARKLCELILKRADAHAKVRDFLLQLKQEKRTILLNTHQLAEAERVCDRVGIMHTKLIAVGTPDGLRGTGSGPWLRPLAA